MSLEWARAPWQAASRADRSLPEIFQLAIGMFSIFQRGITDATQLPGRFAQRGRINARWRTVRVLASR
jgi:hypothetical protein